MQLQRDLDQVRLDSKAATEKAVQNHQQIMGLQEIRCETEMVKLNLLQSVHLTLIEAVEELGGGFVFNEVPEDRVEFRFYLDQVVDASQLKASFHNFLVVGSQTHLQACQKKSAANKKGLGQSNQASQGQIPSQTQFNSVLALDAVFQIEASNQFKNDSSKYFFIKLHSVDSKADSQQADVSQIMRQFLIQESPDHQVKIHKDISQCFAAEAHSRSVPVTPNLPNLDESMTMQELETNQAMKEGTYTILVVQIAQRIAEKHTNEAEMLCEVQNAISTGQAVSNLLRVEALLVLSLSTNPQLVQYWLNPRWSQK